MEILVVIVFGYFIIMALQNKVKATADKHFDNAERYRDSGDSVGQIGEASRGCANGIIVLIIGVGGLVAIYGILSAIVPPRGM